MERMKLDIQLFAVRGWELYLENLGYNIEEGYHTVRIYATITTDNSSYNYNNPSGSYTIDGTTYSFSHNIGRNTTTTLFDQNYRIYHDNEYIVNANFAFNTGISAGTITDSASLTLPLIPRATPAISMVGTMGEQNTYYLQPYSSSFSHTITLSSGSWSDTISVPANQNSFNYTFPTTLIGSANTTTGIATFYTYNGGTLVGQTSSEFVAYVPSGAYPTLNGVTMVDTNPATIALTNDNGNSIVTTKSIPTVTFDATFKYGATFSRGLTAVRVDDYNLYVITEQTQNPATVEVSQYTPNENSTIDYASITDNNGRMARLDPLSLPNRIVRYKGLSYIIPPTLEVSRPELLGQDTKLGIVCEYWNGYFDLAQTNPNTITVQWKVKDLYGNESAWQTFTNYITTEAPSSVDGNRMVIQTGYEDTETGDIIYEPVSITNPLDPNGLWDYSKTYIITVKFSDLLEEITLSNQVLSAIPIYDAWQDSDSNRYFNINGKLLFNNEELDTYDTSFTPTGKNWLDGKPIYRKCYAISSSISTGNTVIDSDTSAIETIVNRYGGYKSSDESWKFALPYAYPGQVVEVYIIGGQLWLHTDVALTSGTLYVILECTLT